MRGATVALLPVEKLVELKLASGLSSMHRARDLGDVVELVKHAKLARELSDQLDASVRDKYVEIWDALQTPDPMDES